MILTDGESCVLGFSITVSERRERGVDEREIHGGNGYAYTYVVGEQERANLRSRATGMIICVISSTILLNQQTRARSNSALAFSAATQLVELLSVLQLAGCVCYWLTPTHP